nr:hypothetical protein [Tanacetum cinerariifolium]
DNDQKHIQALVDKTKVIITEDNIRSDLHLDDAEGTACLLNEEIFEGLASMGAKTTTWNEFSSTIASATICLADNQKFNFSNDPLPSGEDSSIINELMIFCTVLQEQVLDVQEAKAAQAKEIAALKKKDGLGAQEDASKQGRIIEEIDQNAEIALDDETQGRTNDDEMFAVDDLAREEVVIDSAADPVTIVKESAAPTIDVTKDEITMAQALAALKRKAKMIEPEVPLKKKEQMRIDKEYARKLQAEEQEATRLSRAQQDEKAKNSWDNIQAMMDADRLLVERLQAREREEFLSTKRTAEHLESDISKKQKIDKNVEPTIDDSEELRKCIEIVHDDGDEVLIEATPISSRSPTIIDYKIHKEGKKNYFKIIRADERLEEENMVLKELKSVHSIDNTDEPGWFKMNYFKGMTYDEIKPLLEKHHNFTQTFLDKVNEGVKVSETKVRQEKDVEVESSKRECENLKKEITKKQRTEEETEEDLESLWIIVKDIFEKTKPKNYSDDYLLNTLKIMFEKPNVEASVWKDQKGRYGLAKQMLNNVRLQVKDESEMSLELLRLKLDIIIDDIKFKEGLLGIMDFHNLLLLVQLSAADEGLVLLLEITAAFVFDEEREEGEVNANYICMTKLHDASSNTNTVHVYKTDRLSEHSELPKSTQGTYVEQQYDSNIMAETPNVDLSEGDIEQHVVNNKETNTDFESLFNNFKVELDKGIMVNCEGVLFTKKRLTQKLDDLTRSSEKMIKSLNIEILNLKNQLSNQETAYSTLEKERDELKFKFSKHEDELREEIIESDHKIE